MAAKALPPQSLLNQLLDYDPATGRLRWRPRDVAWFPGTPARTAEHCAAQWNATHAGKPALDGLSGNGYREGTLLGVSTKAHRVIWKMLHGTEPPQIDHANHDRSDNRAENLSAATYQTNTRNGSVRSNNVSGVTGVYWRAREGRWCASIRVNRRGIQLGTFKEFDDAVAARRAAEVTYGFHQNHGR